MNHRYISTHPIHFTFMLLAAAAVLLFILGRWLTAELTYARITSFAETLPAYAETKLSTGERGKRECYVDPNRQVCDALTLHITDSSDLAIATAAFAAAAREQGITWTDTTRSTYISSNTFTRGKDAYHIDVQYAANGTAVVTLFAH